MYRFLLYSLILHSIIIAILFASQLFIPKPKNIKIQLAVLPKNNNVKKTIPPVEEPKIEEKKESAEEQQKKAEQAQKLLDNVLKEDIKEKTIEKTIIPKEVKPQPIAKESKKSISKTPQEVIVEKKQPQQKEVAPKQLPTPKMPEPKPSILEKTTPKDTQKVIQKTEEPSPYSNPVLPQNSKPKEPDPYANPVIPSENIFIPNEEVIVPSLPPVKPARKEFNISKDENVSTDANRIINDSTGISNNIMSKEAFYLSDSDKRALMNQMSQCMASLGIIRENNESVTLLIEMKEDARIKDINVIKNNKIVPKSELNNLEARVIYLFNNPKCSKLILPEGKFSYWQKFTIKLNLKGLFE